MSFVNSEGFREWMGKPRLDASSLPLSPLPPPAVQGTWAVRSSAVNLLHAAPSEMRCLQAAALQQSVQPARPASACSLAGSSLTAGQPRASRSQRACLITPQPAGSGAHRPAAARRPATHGRRLASLPERLEQLAAEWLAQDTQPSSRQEIEELVAAEDAAGLEERLGRRLQFGAAVGPAMLCCRRRATRTV